MSSTKSTLCLLATAMIWGGGFIGQRIGMDSIGPFYFTAFRSVVAFIFLAVLAWLGDNKEKAFIKQKKKEEKSGAIKRTLLGGVLCGTVLFFASNMQQFGLVTVDAGKAGFITALYIVLVPIFGIFLKHKTTIFCWIGVGLGVIGLYFLCVSGSMSMAKGDLVIMLGAVFWAMHILVTDHFAPRVNVVKLSALQFLTAAVLSLILAAFMEDISAAAVSGSLLAILYCGVFSSGIAFTMQALGQKNANPTVASIVLSTESLWALVFGFIFLHEVMTGREIAGCIIMFAAVLIAQVPAPAERKK